MSNIAHISDDLSTAYIPSANAVVSTGLKQEPKPTKINNSSFGSQPWAYWGEDNLFPQNVISDANKSTIISPVLEWKAKALYSGGLVYGTVETDVDSGEEVLTPIQDDDIEAWLKMSGINKQLIRMATDYYWFYNVFPQLILSKDKSIVAAMHVESAAFHRWQKKTEETNWQIKKCYLNGDWERKGNLENCIELPVLDLLYDGVGKLKSRKDGDIFVYPLSYPTPGRIYYSLAAWNSIRDSGWFDVAKSIPLFKKNLMKNQVSIKYHVEVADWYWGWKYPGFDNKPPKERKEIVEKELEKFNDIMTGEDNVGKTLMTTTRTDVHGGKGMPGITINAVDDKLKDGVYIEDSQEASSHHYSALGVDPTLVGVSPGKKMGAGSGSDKRVAFNIYLNSCKTDQDLILEPLNFIAEYNGWTMDHPNLKFWFRNYYISTLDKGSETKQANGAV